MKTKNLTLTAIFTALTIVLSQIAIPMPGSVAPLSLSLGAIYLAGAVLPKKYALYSQLLYLLMGVIGLPVFANFTSGVGRILGPTGGYLLAYPLMAFLTALVVELFGKKTLVSYVLGMLASLVVCYLFGSLWYVAVGHVSWAQSLLLTAVPFIATDLLKIAVFALLAAALNRALVKAKLLAA